MDVKTYHANLILQYEALIQANKDRAEILRRERELLYKLIAESKDYTKD